MCVCVISDTPGLGVNRTRHHHMNFRRSHKPPSARSTSTSRRTTSRSTAAFPSWYWSFVAYSEYAQLLPPSCHAGHRTRKQHTRKQPPRAATALLSPRRLSPGRALSGSLTNGALSPLSRPPPRLQRRHLHRPFRCGNERPPSTHSPIPTATSYSQILRARARALS